MNKKNFIATLALGAALAIPAGAAQRETCTGLAFASGQQVAGSFSAKTTVDLDVLVLFDRGEANRFVKAANDLEINLYTPSGDLYQSLRIPFTSSVSWKGAARKVKKYPYPMETQLMQEVEVGSRKYLAASVRVPIAGTSISTNSLYGNWSATAHVDDDPVNCSGPAAASVTITP